MIFFKEDVKLFSCRKIINILSFQMFQIMVEKEIGMPIKYLRIDRGEEFNSAKFNDFANSIE